MNRLSVCSSGRTAMKRFAMIILFLLSCFAAAQGDTPPGLSGGLGWSSQGRYIAVGTLAGVHIHASDILEELLVLDESFFVRSIAWTNNDFRIAYEDFDGESLYIYNAATRTRRLASCPARFPASVYGCGQRRAASPHPAQRRQALHAAAQRRPAERQAGAFAPGEDRIA